MIYQNDQKNETYLLVSFSCQFEILLHGDILKWRNHLNKVLNSFTLFQYDKIWKITECCSKLNNGYFQIIYMHHGITHI